jgi:type I restriction enzyme S subunit
MGEKKGDGIMFETDTIEIFEVPSHWVSEGECRLNASFYSQDVIAARLLLRKVVSKGVTTTPLVDLSDDISMPALKITIPFTDHGEPYLTQSEVEYFLPESRKKINLSKLQHPDKWYVKSGVILISQSGTIGRVTIATKYLERFVISPNPIRLTANEEIIGYLYAFLSSWVGSALIRSPKYGVTVDHILPHHLYNIPVPRIPELEGKINRKILEAHRLREEAQGLLLKTKETLYSELGLPEIDKDDVEYFGGEKGRIIKSFEIKARELDFRLDASYHLPLCRLAIQKLTEARSGAVKRLENIADSFVPPRFKRPYVKNPTDGIPLLQGTHISQTRPQDIKYIWKRMKNLDSYSVKKNWILVTCSGTIGRLSLVRDGWDNWAATNHLLRVIPRENEIHPGYLTAFLLSIYGQVQFQRLTYGGVVDEIGEAGELFSNILILKPANKEVENEIGNLVLEAYDKRDRANQLEDEAIKLLEDKLNRLA